MTENGLKSGISTAHYGCFHSSDQCLMCRESQMFVGHFGSV